MPTFLISYDLRKPGRDYASLHEAIKRLGPWCHPLESFWAVISSSDSATIRDELRKHMDTNDGLLVVVSGDRAAWSGINPALNDWLNQNL